MSNSKSKIEGEALYFQVHNYWNYTNVSRKMFLFQILLELCWSGHCSCKMTRNFFGQNYKNSVFSAFFQISYLILGFSVFRHIHIQEKLKQLNNHPSNFIPFDYLSYGQVQYNNSLAFCLFLTWIKMFKYLSLNRTILQFTKTLKNVHIIMK